MALFKYKNKSASREFSPSMLPTTRKEVFFDVLKIHWGKFLVYGALVLLFSLPIHAIALLEDSNIIQITEAMQEASAEQIQAGYSMIAALQVLFALAKVPFLIFLALFLAGLARVIRQYAWGENVAFWSDFFEGIKTNSLSFTALFILGGLINAGTVYCTGRAGIASSFFEQMLLNLPLMAFIILLVPIFAYATVILTIYKTNIVKATFTALTLYIKAPFKTLLALILCAIPFVAHIIPILICHLLGRLICCFLVPLVFLGWYLFCLDKLDKFVNEKNYPSLVGKGLYKQ